MVVTVSTMPRLSWGCSEQVNKSIGSFVQLIGQDVAMIRACFSALVFTLLLCSVSPVEQSGWAVESIWGSTGGAGHEQACGFNDTGATTESESDSPQEMPDDYVASGVSVPDCGSSRLHAWINKISSSTLLISRLLHPPTSLS